VIQPQVPLRLPCYDFTPVMNHKVVSALPKVKLPTSFATHTARHVTKVGNTRSRWPNPLWEGAVEGGTSDWDEVVTR